MNRKHSRGAVSGGLIVALAVVALVIAIVALCGVSYVSAYNRGNVMEKGIIAAYESNKNVLSTYSQKVVEAAQVTGMMRDDIVKITREAIGNRYGEKGSQAVFQAIREQNPQVSEKLYLNVQQIVDSGREEFKVKQDVLIDKKRVYSTSLDFFWSGTWLHIAGYPKINLDDYKVIITDSIEQTFKTGKERGPIQLRPEPTPQ